MKVLIIANSRYKGGLSGGDAIYESFKKYWPCQFTTWTLEGVDFKPFALCYIWRIWLSCLRSLFERESFDIVYSASDFLPDSLSACLYKITRPKVKWVAGFYLKAFKENPIHYYTQKIVKALIDRFADMVIVTNPTMYYIFPDKKKTWINGGIDLKLAGLSDKPKIYDAVFCGRIHPSKGIDELIHIWKLVREKKPDARLALIGDGDLGTWYIRKKLWPKTADQMGVDLLGYMGNERFDIYKQSKVVLYPTPLKYDHFSMAPVEAMACGCEMICFDNPVNRCMGGLNITMAVDNEMFARFILRYEPWKEVWAYKYANKFDYEIQSLRVYNDVRKELEI